MGQGVNSSQAVEKRPSAAFPLPTGRQAHPSSLQRTFNITSMAAIVTLKDDLVSGARISLGGVGPAPLQATGAEAALKGKKLREGLVTACAAAVEGTRPLGSNGYKVKATKGIMEKALTSRNLNQGLNPAGII